MSFFSLENPLPMNWAAVAVGDVLSLANGFAFKPSHWRQEGLPIIRIQNLNNANAPFNFCSDEIPNRFRVENGDLLFAWSGTPGTSFGAHIWKGGRAWLNQHIFRVGFSVELFDARFLRFAINQNLTAYIAAAHGGAGLAHITKGKFEQSTLKIAPLNEQRRIVAEIDKQFSRLDDAVSALKRVQANLKRYRASVLKAACEGRLVPTEAELARKEGRTYEPASELLKRILADRRAKWTGKAKYVEPYPPANNLPELPNGWVWASLNQLLREPLRNGHSAKETNGAGVRTLTLTAVTYGDFSESNVKVTSADPEKVRDLWIQPGDIFVERSNTPELVGIARLFNGPKNFAIFPDLLIRVRLCTLVSAKFIEALLLSESVRHYFRRSAQGISGSMPKVDQGVIERLPVPLPPLAEQCRIATEVEHQCGQLLASEQDAFRAFRLANNLRQAILKHAFSGKLVPQDSNDKPASVLLERIRASRAALAINNGNQKATPEAGTANGQRRRRAGKLAQGVSPGKG